MSREIKFRAWEFEGKFMNHSPLHHVSFHGEVFEGSGNVKQGNYALMQFTGMSDKNEKEIYEGDIVRYWGGVAPIEYNMFGFAIKATEDEYFDINEPDKIEVIGNIYENANLIDK
jgi:uncharacterized phage protein (TIGR01671 family)